MKTKRCKVSTRTEGQNFATVGVITAMSGQVIGCSLKSRPYGFHKEALADARSLAVAMGYMAVRS